MSYPLASSPLLPSLSTGPQLRSGAPLLLCSARCVASLAGPSLEGARQIFQRMQNGFRMLVPPKPGPTPFSPEDRWWTEETVAVVTGANKGLGFHIARGLAQSGVHTVVTSRNAELGQQAVDELRAEGLGNVSYHVLDVTDRDSVDQFARWIQSEHKGLDILVNNAGVLRRGVGVFETFGPGPARETLATNYYGSRSVTEALLPCLRASPSGARIVNVSSGLGHLHILSAPLQERFKDPALTLEQIDSLAQEYLDSMKQGTFKDQGWPQSAYGVSKVLLNAYTRVLAEQLAERPEGHRVHVNAYCPGWCATDMGTSVAPRSAQEGADTGLYLALLPANQATSGKLYKDRALSHF